MEKKTPHYDLAAIKTDVTRLGATAFTLSARDGGRKMGFTLADMLQIIKSLERRMLYKSMTTYADHRIWQDVYHYPLPGKLIYIKVSYRPAGGPPVISFKESES
ncbi:MULTISPECIES: type II toxin-antitoxin system MqsR family toxin [Pseudomonas]|uniref:Type II toxin-antitoxin system MqsR family toxin n=1 Tax=Pseudomonas gingeri TaxID=117681 RepID=A0A7Y8BRJ5_9PSED|nr:MULTISPECIES: type II toxin-antitoxin system MqsR family toxin [Pseudomonas]MPQ68833.1 type II toxin-antitoxin system MqsR family toxin [Pseudomonas sp. MWU12-2323]NWB84797.1 type II toxin-antitoxin system MqsR family toxin [Pseudomonas gingeri]